MFNLACIRRSTVLLGAVLCVAAGSLGPGGSVRATPSSGFTSVTISASAVPEIALKTLSATHQVRIHTKGLSDVHMTTNVVAPGGTSGWHTHPGPSIVVVKSGTATVYDGDDPTCTPQVYEAGSAFVDIGGGDVHVVRNENTVNLETMAFQIVPAGEPRRIDVPVQDVLAACGF
jgi:quercetin dioxygenase-like cupin family protein